MMSSRAWAGQSKSPCSFVVVGCGETLTGGHNHVTVQGGKR